MMQWCVVWLLLVLSLAGVYGYEQNNLDPASRQLEDFKKETKKPIGILTTSAGRPVDVRETVTLNSDLISNSYFLDVIEAATHERIIPRVVFTKGTGATGYFEVTHDVSEYTKAKVFQEVGKKTSVRTRLSQAFVEPGSNDANPFSSRALSSKFYTEEGNLDFLSISIPVYLYNDPVLFPSAAHVINKRNPKTNLRDPNALLDFIAMKPIALHGVLWFLSEFGLPRGYRKMNVYPIHTYQLTNKKGDIHFVRFKFLTEQGFDSFTLKEAASLASSDPDFFTRDLYNAIESHNYPSWKLEMDVMSLDDVKNADFDPFEVTRLWPNGTYHTVPIGRLVLNKNPENQFAEVEQLAFNPSNLVPGIDGPVDQIYKGRNIAYPMAQAYRLGINRNKIEVNRPWYANTYDRDGKPPVRDNMKDAPVYYPNTFNGPVPTIEITKPKHHIDVYSKLDVDLQPVAYFYNHVVASEKQKQSLIDNTVMQTLRASAELRERFVNLIRLVDVNFGKRLDHAYKMAEKNTVLPNMVEDIKKEEL